MVPSKIMFFVRWTFKTSAKCCPLSEQKGSQGIVLGTLEFQFNIMLFGGLAVHRP